MPALSGPPRLRIATKIGLIAILIALFWWLAYYTQYAGTAFMREKLWCIAETTDACAFYQQQIAGAVPAYPPWLWWIGLALALFGRVQGALARLLGR
jgi:hypothetical protein